MYPRVEALGERRQKLGKIEALRQNWWIQVGNRARLRIGTGQFEREEQ
jgi:hypothetical protein